MSPASIQTPVFISYCSPVQDRKVHTSIGDSVVIGQHVYKHVCTPLTDKRVSASMWEDNKHDKYAVKLIIIDLAISKRKMHISREISKMPSFYLMHNTKLLFIKFNNCGTRHLNESRHFLFILLPYPVYICQ